MKGLILGLIFVLWFLVGLVMGISQANETKKELAGMIQETKEIQNESKMYLKQIKEIRERF